MADEERDEKSRDIKVTDRRMFTPDGKLKEEYRWLEEERPPKDEAAREPAAPPEREEASTVAEPAGPSPTAEAPGAPTVETPGDLRGGESRERHQTAPEGAAAGTQPAGPSAPPGPSGEAGQGPTGTPLELPDTPDSMGKPGFLDLLAVLAEPATIYLGDAALPDGRQAEDLRAARLYIDMLTVLREKTSGNLSAQEQAVMDDLLYRLQMRYLQKRG